MRYLSFRQRFKVPNYLNSKEVITGFLAFDPRKCKRCWLCTRICPARSIIMGEVRNDGDKPIPYVKQIAPDITMCIACGACVVACKQGAISIVRGFRPLFYFNRISQAPEFEYPHKY